MLLALPLFLIHLLSQYGGQFKIIDVRKTDEPAHCIFYKLASAPSEESDQPARMHKLIRVFDVRLKMLRALGYPQSAREDADARRLIALLGGH